MTRRSCRCSTILDFLCLVVLGRHVPQFEYPIRTNTRLLDYFNKSVRP